MKPDANIKFTNFAERMKLKKQGIDWLRQEYRHEVLKKVHQNIEIRRQTEQDEIERKRKVQFDKYLEKYGEKYGELLRDRSLDYKAKDGLMEKWQETTGEKANFEKYWEKRKAIMEKYFALDRNALDTAYAIVPINFNVPIVTNPYKNAKFWRYSTYDSITLLIKRKN